MRVREGEFEVEVEGPRAYVEERIASALAGRPGGAGRVQQAEAGGGAAPRRLIEFLKVKQPSGHPEIATVIAYWAKERTGAADISGDDLARYYKEAEERRPANPANVMAKAASSRGWLESVGGGRYRLTTAGEDHVRLDLPRSKGASV